MKRAKAEDGEKREKMEKGGGNCGRDSISKSDKGEDDDDNGTNRSRNNMLMRPPLRAHARPSVQRRTNNLRRISLFLSLFLGDSTAFHAAKPRLKSAATRAETA